MIDALLQHIPDSLKDQSGSVFYSGRTAFSAPSLVYVLGLNPGGSPCLQAQETVSWHTSKVFKLEKPNWSAYRDESWCGRPPGTHGMQPRVLQLFQKLNRDPGRVPSSNVVFLRSARESGIKGKFRDLARLCWPFHQNVIDQLGVRVVVCFGNVAGDWVQKRLAANTHVETYTENNGRRWQSNAYWSAKGMGVVVLKHPSRAAWTNPRSDPTDLVLRMLKDVA
jgi:hypothetical protein